MERERTTGSGPELVRGEDGCEFAACRKSVLINSFPCILCIYFLLTSKPVDRKSEIYPAL